MADDLLEIGTVHKPHGLRGEVVVSLTTNMVEERTAPGAELFLGDKPVVVVAARPHQDRWLMLFEGVGGRNEAEALRGARLFATPLDADDDQVFVHELVGRRLIDQHGSDHGVIDAVVENPAADLLELDSGILVPLAFYVSHDDEHVHVDVPPGLLDDDSVTAR